MKNNKEQNDKLVIKFDDFMYKSVDPDINENF